jgi:hypothetical protein
MTTTTTQTTTTQTTTTPTLADKPAPKPYTKREIHPLAKGIFPPITGDEYEVLKKDIDAHGVRHAIVLYQGKILDGCNRDKVCYELNIDPPTTTLPQGVDPIDFVVSANINRRHLTGTQRGMVAASLATMKRGDNQHSGREGLSIERTSKMLNISEATANRCKKVLTSGVPKLAELVVSGKLPASVAEKVAGLDKGEQAVLVEKSVKQITEATKSLPQRTANSERLDKLKKSYLEVLKKLGKAEQEAAVAEMLKAFADMGLTK